MCSRTFPCFVSDPSLSTDEILIIEEKAVNDCFKVSGNGPKKDETYETPSDYDPLAVNMGQMTVHRFTLRCKCDTSKLKADESCGTFLPFDQQRWPSLMGLRGDSRFNTKSEDPVFGGHHKT